MKLWVVAVTACIDNEFNCNTVTLASNSQCCIVVAACNSALGSAHFWAIIVNLLQWSKTVSLYCSNIVAVQIYKDTGLEWGSMLFSAHMVEVSKLPVKKKSVTAFWSIKNPGQSKRQENKSHLCLIVQIEYLCNSTCLVLYQLMSRLTIKHTTVSIRISLVHGSINFSY